MYSALAARRGTAPSVDLQPKGATALYGLGLAEQKKGLQAAGDQDIQAAAAIDPAAADEFRSVRLVPKSIATGWQRAPNGFLRSLRLSFATLAAGRPAPGPLSQVTQSTQALLVSSRRR